MNALAPILTLARPRAGLLLGGIVVSVLALIAAIALMGLAGGMVAAGSFRREPGSMEAHFLVDDGDAKLPVVYTGILPDQFRENQSVVATGRMRGQVFVAEEVLAKHDETYMPKEVADKMADAHRRHNVAETADTPAQGAPQ